MRAAFFSALAVLAAATPGLTAPVVARVNVSIGETLAKKTDIVGPREIRDLATSLQRAVERQVRPVAGGGTLNLVLEDAVANRPTPTQLSSTPGLSIESFGVGGARISGEYVDPAGVHTPIDYAWSETDIRWARYGGTWHDADVAFDKLAARLAKDQYSEAR